MRELSLNVLDIAQNSIAADASLIGITVEQDSADGWMRILIADNGRGMSPEKLQSVRDPFFTTRTTRKVGMGVPLFKMAAEMTGGSLDIASEEGRGTQVTARFQTRHIDCAPLGDINSTISLLIRMNPGRHFVYTHRLDGREFTLDTREMREMLGDVPLDAPDVMEWVDEYLREQSETIQQGRD